MRWLLTVIVMLACLSCGKVQYVPVAVESVKTEYRDRLLRDSIYVLDSIMVKEDGDTVWLERWRTVYRDRLLRDTVLKTDTIPTPYPVEKSLTWWEQAKVDYGGAAFLGLAVVVICGLAYVVYKLKK